MAQRPAFSWLAQWEYAHRGAHGANAPENSRTAALLAIRGGLGIECDIQLSSDDVPMVFHDWDLRRMFGRDDLLADCSASELADLGIMRFADLIALAAGKVPLLVELKSRADFDVVRACEAVDHCLSGGQQCQFEIAVMSFDPRVSAWFRKHSPKFACGLVVREDEDGDTQTSEARQLAFDQAEPDFLAYHVAALPGPWVASLRASGVLVLTWTVNSKAARIVALEHADALIAEGAGLG